MICPDCGTENPDGAAFCSNCSATLGGGGGFRLASPGGTSGSDPHQSGGSSFAGSSFSDSSSTSVNDALFGGANSNYASAYDSDIFAPAKKTQNNNWIIAIVAVVVLAALVIGAGYSVLGWQYNGTYEFDEIYMKYGGQELSYTREQMEAMIQTEMEISIKLSFGTATMKVDSAYQNYGMKSYKGKYKIKGNKLIFTGDPQYDDYFNMVIDRKAKTITLNLNAPDSLTGSGDIEMKMVFKKK